MIPSDREIYVEEAYDDETMALAAARKLPLTFGYEIEQPDEIVPEVMRRIYAWDRDLSGPIEMRLPPSTHPTYEVKKFVSAVLTHRAKWEWHNEYRDEIGELRGCGSHLHFRVREEMFRHLGEGYVNDVWATAYNTFIEVTPFLIPILAWSGVYRLHRFRRKVKRWAMHDSKRVSVAEAGFCRSPTYINTCNYKAVVFKRKTEEKPLTIEVRLAESPPQVSMYFSSLMGRIVKECLSGARPLSPRLSPDVRGGFFEAFRNLLYEAAYYYDKDVYWVLRELKNIKFDRPIPRLKDRYDNALEVFKDILVYYTPGWDPYMRLFYFFMNELKPYENQDAVWEVFMKFGIFYWERPLVGDHEISSFFYNTAVKVRGWQ